MDSGFLQSDDEVEDWIQGNSDPNEKNCGFPEN